jgi:hypothetical protein
MLVRGVFGEAGDVSIVGGLLGGGGLLGKWERETYAGARVVFKKVDLQT